MVTINHRRPQRGVAEALHNIGWQHRAEHASRARQLNGARREALTRAKARLDPLVLYPRPVSLRQVRILVVPWLFRLPWFRRFDGYALHVAILLRSARASDELIVHELCHVWQLQHRPLSMPFSFLIRGYARNPYELEARRAAKSTCMEPR